MRSEEVVVLKEVVVMAYAVRQIGNAALMDLAKTSFLSSRKISPEAVLRCYDRAIRMRDEGRCVISGFQSDLEKDELLLAAGFALSPVIAEDAVFAFCIQSEVFDLFELNRILYEQGLKIIPPK